MFGQTLVNVCILFGGLWTDCDMEACPVVARRGNQNFLFEGLTFIDMQIDAVVVAVV